MLKIIVFVSPLGNVVNPISFRCNIIDERLNAVVIMFAHDINEVLLGGQHVDCECCQLPGYPRVMLGQSPAVHLIRHENTREKEQEIKLSTDRFLKLSGVAVRSKLHSFIHIYRQTIQLSIIRTHIIYS